MTGYIIWPKGDTRLHTCRVYKTLQEASDAAQERADFHHRPYEVRVTCDTSQRIICREMLGNADSIFSPKFDKETKQSEDTKK